MIITLDKSSYILDLTSSKLGLRYYLCILILVYYKYIRSPKKSLNRLFRLCLEYILIYNRIPNIVVTIYTIVFNNNKGGIIPILLSPP